MPAHEAGCRLVIADMRGFSKFGRLLVASGLLIRLSQVRESPPRSLATSNTKAAIFCLA